MDYTRIAYCINVLSFIRKMSAQNLDMEKENGGRYVFKLDNAEKTTGTVDDLITKKLVDGEVPSVDKLEVAAITNQDGIVNYELRYNEASESIDNGTIILDLAKADGSNGKYPEVFLSPLAYTCLAGYPPGPDKPVRPTYIEKQSYQSEGRLLKGTYWLLAGILCPMLLLKSGEPLFLFFWTLIIFNAIAIYYFIKHFKNKNAFIKDIEKENSIKERRYQNQLTEYNWQIKRNKTEEYIKEYRRKMASCYLTRSISSGLIPCCDDDIVKKGPAEEFLANALKESYTILTDKKIRINRSFYYPDIVIVKGGMYIDVEIDEPYSNEGIPIHYQEDKGDKMRNEFFTENGWEVIRFSEKQVFNNTKECISFIGKYITSIQKCSSTISIDEAFIDPKCTRAEALSLAKLDYRSFYLPQSIRIGKGTPNDNATSLSSSDLDDLPF